MIARVLAIAAATLRESTRSAVARLAALLLLVCVPVMAWLVGEDEGGRVWAARTFTVEGLRLILPLAAVVGGAFLLRPNLKRGWATLPAQRGEWFAGAALAGLCMILVSTMLFVCGAFVDMAASRPTANLLQVHRPLSMWLGSTQQEGHQSQQDWCWAAYSKGEYIMIEFPRPEGKGFYAEIEYELVWTQEAPPMRDVPFRAEFFDKRAYHEPGARPGFIYSDEVRALSRRRASIRADVSRGSELWLRIVPTDPSLIVGVRPSGVVLSANSVNPYASTLRLTLLAIAASVLCMAVSLWFRTWSTAPTAALAGLLLLAALTLLPGIAPTGQMAADRRADVEADKDALKTLESTVARLPELLPALPFDTYLRGREVDSTLADAAWRGLIALALLPLGAITFRRRQIAK